MKKFFILAALSAITLAACASGSIEDKKAKLEADLQAVVAEFNECKTALLKDSTLTTEQLEAKYEEAYNKAIKTYNDICIKTIKKNRNNELGLEAFKQVYYQLEPKEALEVIGLLGADIQNDDFVVKAKSTLEAASRAAEGQPFVDFEVDGVKFSDFVGKGKYILVDFWASWCGPCKGEIPNLKHVYETYAGPDFDLLSVAVWDKPEDTVASAKEHGVVWNQIINAQKIASDAYGFDSIPQIMLFGPDGTILKKGLRGPDIEKAVKEALGR